MIFKFSSGHERPSFQESKDHLFLQRERAGGGCSKRERWGRGRGGGRKRKHRMIRRKEERERRRNGGKERGGEEEKGRELFCTGNF